MMPTIIVHILLALPVLLFLAAPSHVQTLPITSKPIESTAENLAWQAWLMLPPEQKNLEKSRKVTPKSIFTLPFRDCPPGHQLIQSLCISTVNIDPAALITQQLLDLVGGSDDNGGSNYEFDYDDEEGGPTYEPPQHLSGEGASGGSFTGLHFNMNNNYDDAAQQLPSKDEPLKFNIFQQTFPTDYGEGESAAAAAVAAPNEGAPKVVVENRPNNTNIFNGTQFQDIVQKYLERQANATRLNNNTNPIADLQTDSSYVSKIVVANSYDEGSGGYATPATADHTTPTTGTTTERSFSISDIDAIMLPAIASNADASSGSGHEHKATNHRGHKFSLFKDDSLVQLVTSTFADRNYHEATQPDITQMLKDDALLPLFNIAQASPAITTTTTTTAESSSKGTSLFDDSSPTAATLAMNEVSWATTPLLLAQQHQQQEQETDDEVTGMTTIEDADTEATTMPSELTKLLAEVEAIEETEPQKDERTRSVTMRSSEEEYIDDEEDEEDVNADISTTIEPDVTTHIQLDETTIIEAFDPPTIELQELQAQHPRKHSERENHTVLKKSKVEPVGEFRGDGVATLKPATTKETSKSTATTTETTETTATSSSSSSSISLETSTPLPSATTTMKTTLPAALTADTKDAAAADDRFYYHHLNRAKDSNQGGGARPASASGKYIIANRRGSNSNNFMMNMNSNSLGSSATSSKTSEINIEQELRMINELVKGKRQLAAPTKTTTTTSMPPMSTETTESSFTAETEVAAVKVDEVEETKVAESENDETETKTSQVTATPTAPTSVSSNKETSTIFSKNINVAHTTSKSLVSSTDDSKSSSTTSATTTTTNEPLPVAATIWSKIMPILGFGSSTQATVATTVATTVSTATISSTPTEPHSSTQSQASLNEEEDEEPQVETTSISSSSSSSSSSSTSSISINSNRSNRNSKIIRINNLSTNSLSDSGSSTSLITNIEEASDKHSTTTTTPATTTTTTTTTTTEASSHSFEPFWWLPVGWRLDRQANTAEEQPLLLRFWSAFPGNHQQ